MSKPLYLQALDGLRKREWLLRVLIFTLVTIVFWIGFSIYLSQSESKISIDIRKHTESLNPNINREALEELIQRQRYTDEELQDFPLYEVVVDKDGGAGLVQVGAGPVVVVGEDGSSTSTPAAIPFVEEVIEEPASQSATASESAEP